MIGKTRLVSQLTAVLLLLTIPTLTVGETATGVAAGNDADPRKLVEMPEQARGLIKADMIDHLAALNEILAYLAAGKLEAAAETAEKENG